MKRWGKRTVMNRAKLGSVLFLGGLLFVVGAERNDAHADAPVNTPVPVANVKIESGEAVPANAGLKVGSTVAVLGPTYNEHAAAWARSQVAATNSR